MATQNIGNTRIRIRVKPQSKKQRNKWNSYKVSVQKVENPHNAYVVRSNAYKKIYAQEKHEIELMTSGLQRFAVK